LTGWRAPSVHGDGNADASDPPRPDRVSPTAAGRPCCTDCDVVSVTTFQDAHAGRPTLAVVNHGRPAQPKKSPEHDCGASGFFLILIDIKE
jgi:hypothetical protein